MLAPTRELAQQIQDVATAISSHMGITVYSATGGTPLRDDIRAIERGCQFLIGTPGRVYDLMNRNVLHRDQIRVLIMDEADQMLEDRFKEQVMCPSGEGVPEGDAGSPSPPPQCPRRSWRSPTSCCAIPRVF